MKRKALIATGGVLLAALGAFLLLRDGGAQDPGREPHEAARPERIAKDKPKARKPKVAAPKTKPSATVGGDGMSPSDRKISESVQTALDDEDLTGLRDQLAAAKASTNAAVRQATVEALGWFGTKAMSDIVAFIEDPDEDVRDAARTCWEQIIVEVDEEPVQAAIVEETLLGTRDVDFAETLASHYNGMDEQRAIESILKVISGGTKTAVKAVKESYEFITGEEYTTPAAARAWLRENYTPPDKED